MWRARDRAVESSWLAPLLGAGVGALVARAVQSRARDRGFDRHREDWRGDGYGYPRGRYAELAAEQEEYDVYGVAVEAEGDDAGGDTAGSKLAEKGAQAKERARATAEQVKDRARTAAEQVKGRLHEATSSARERLPDRERLRASAREDTGLWALGALALGALFGFALPESEREREMLEPARRKARELGAQAREKALEKGSEAMEKATEKVASTGEQRPAGPQGAAGTPPAGSPTPLH
jgi:hypothetical protein